MSAADKCQRLKDILQGKTINCQRPAFDNGERTKPEQASRRTSTADRLKENLLKKQLKDDKVLRLRQILGRGKDSCEGHQVDNFVQDHATVTSSELQANHLVSAPQVTSPAEPESNENTTRNQSETVQRLRRILGKKSCSEVSQTSTQCCAEATAEKVAHVITERATPVVVTNVNTTLSEDYATKTDRRGLVPKHGAGSSNHVQVTHASENSTPEPQADGIGQKRHRIARRRLPQGARTDVTLVGIRSNLLYVQETSVVRELVDMMRTLQFAVAVEPPITEILQPKTYVAALQPRDETWYRARVERNHGDSVQVFYIDYGSKGTVSVKNLKPLPEAFIDIPSFAMSVRPQGVDEVDDDILPYLREKVLVAEAVERVGKEHVVKLFEKESGQCINEVLKELLEVSEEQ